MRRSSANERIADVAVLVEERWGVARIEAIADADAVAVVRGRTPYLNNASTPRLDQDEDQE